MEFPNAGIQCSVKTCKQLDFLPFTCNYCSNIYCKEHFPAISHSCLKFNDNVVDDLKRIETVVCSDETCQDRSPIEILCVVCKKHYCISHRYHGCLEQSEESKADELKKWEKPKNQFSEAKTVVDQQISRNLEKSKNSKMANKVQLMRLKGMSIGSNNIPISERCYFLVHLPIAEKSKIPKGSKGAFVSSTWSIGKVIDSIADLFNIPNFNNQQNAAKLRMFNYNSGNVITNQMDTTLSELLNSNDIVNGQDVILEYSNSEKIDCSLYK